MKKTDEALGKCVGVVLLGIWFLIFSTPHLVTAKSSLLPFIGVITPAGLFISGFYLFREYRKEKENV